jgi:hypothetical protein
MLVHTNLNPPDLTGSEANKIRNNRVQLGFITQVPNALEAQGGGGNDQGLIAVAAISNFSRASTVR